MSKYLCVGLAKEIMVKAEDEDMAKKLEKDFFSKVDRNLYDVELTSFENYNYLYLVFRLKDDMLVKYAMDLMIEQNQKYIKSRDSKEAIKYYKKLKNKSNEEFIELINTENNRFLYNFRLGWYGFDISYIFENRVDAYITEFLEFHCSEKTFMEEYSTFFNYMRNLLINSTANPLRTAIAIAL